MKSQKKQTKPRSVHENLRQLYDPLRESWKMSAM